MLRAGLNLYLMFATLAGPWLCCCTTARLGDQLVSLVKKGYHGSSSCCCKHASEPQNKRNSDNSQPSKVPPCPCQENRSHLVPLSTLDCEETRQTRQADGFQRIIETLGALPATGVLGLNDCLLPDETRDLPFLMSRMILRTFHIMRC